MLCAVVSETSSLPSEQLQWPLRHEACSDGYDVTARPGVCLPGATTEGFVARRRVAEVLHELLPNVLGNLGHTYKAVREEVGRSLTTILAFDSSCAFLYGPKW